MKEIPPEKRSFFLPVLQFVLIVAAVVVTLGVILGWRTRLQFSDGFFWAAMLSAGIALGSTFVFAGAAIRTAYVHPGEGGVPMLESLRTNYRQTRSVRRFTAQVSLVALLCFALSVIIGW